MGDPDRQKEMLQTNEEQKEYYSLRSRRSLATRLWGGIRGQLGAYLNACGQKEYVRSLHLGWMGDLQNSEVLDLGCHRGNALSCHMAARAKSYLGIDLSEPAIEILKSRIAGFPRAEAKALDFLTLPGAHTFDLIYAYAVLHHFRHVDQLIEHLRRHLKPGGRIITYDPLQTFLPMRILRAFYRPFQTDAAWEWPFSLATVRLLADSFECLAMEGILGRAKWGYLLWPFAPQTALALGKKGMATDRRRAGQINRHLASCLHLTMHLRLKEMAH